MLVKDIFDPKFYDKWGDVDVFDNVCEDLGSTYCGTLLTKEGRSHFRSVLNLRCKVFSDNLGYHIVVIDIEGEGWERRLKKCKELFEGADGYCSDKDWNKWFTRR